MKIKKQALKHRESDLRFAPLYTKLQDNEWDKKLEKLKYLYSQCQLCPKKCMVNREKGEIGFCQAGSKAKVASYNIHFGEEPPISGIKGSGTIFFSGCNLKCCFCQNFPISHLCNGKEYSINELKNIMLQLQKRGAHNINLVSSAPQNYHFLSALREAVKEGLKIPIVYNTSGYENLELLEIFKNIIDIYLPDFKYSNNKISKKLSRINDYPKHSLEGIIKMYKHLGKLKTDKNGIAYRGVIIRHLILPNNIENSLTALDILKKHNLDKLDISLMSQFFPVYQSDKWNLDRKITKNEYQIVEDKAISLGFNNGWFQGLD